MRLNRSTQGIYTVTYEGAKARQDQSLERIALTTMLWENTFYESGSSIAQRLAEAVHRTPAEEVVRIALRARTAYKLRHAPLFIARELARHKNKHEVSVAGLLGSIIQRADELSEFLAMYWLDGRQPLSAQVKKGLAKAFSKFDAYQLAKYDRKATVRLRDVLFLVHPKAKDEEQQATWDLLAADKLPAPDTWEVALSASKGEDKKGHWERLLAEKRLGALALLRNLRNMLQEGVSEGLIKDALAEASYRRILPFRFLAAAKAAPRLEPSIEAAMLRAAEGFDKLPGRTALLVDTSGSMTWKADKNGLTMLDKACGLAILARELCEDIDVWVFSTAIDRLPARRGFALADGIRKWEYTGGGTYLGKAVEYVQQQKQPVERLIVITDEQSHDRVPQLSKRRSYIMNVASYNKAVDFGGWTTIHGFSEACLQWIRANEELDGTQTEA